MKKISFLLFILCCILSLTSCDKKENISDLSMSCGCSQIVECTADCGCGCQE